MKIQKYTASKNYAVRFWETNIMRKYAKSGKYLGEKVKFPDGVGVCIWEPLDPKEPEVGICFDFAEEDIDDLINLLRQLKEAKARVFSEPKKKKKK